MEEFSTSVLLAMAQQQFDAGMPWAAEGLCQRLLTENPRHCGALCLLARCKPSAEALELFGQVRRIDPTYLSAHPQMLLALGHLLASESSPAIDALTQGLELSPENPDSWRLLAELLERQEQNAAALKAYQEALKYQPDEELEFRVARMLLKLGRTREARAIFESLLTRQPDRPAIHGELGQLAALEQRWDEAMGYARQAIELGSSDPQDYLLLGDALLENGWPDEALATYRQGLSMAPDHGPLLKSLGQSVGLPGMILACLETLRQKIESHPDDPEGYFQLANLLLEQRQIDPAIGLFRQALSLEPAYTAAWNNLAMALKETGAVQEALEALAQAEKTAPQLPTIGSNRLYTRHFHPTVTACELFDEHRQWAQRHTDSLPALLPPAVFASGRRRRIGYVSPYFCSHPVGRFLTRWLGEHDRDAFEVRAYAAGTRRDAVSEQIRRSVKHWVEVPEISDAALAEQIRADQIDILVDLSMHMAHHSLLAFGRKPAPVQITYLAYASTTGLRQMDYRLTDPYLDPAPDAPGWYSEKSLHLPRSYWCYGPPQEAPEVNALPAIKNGYVTLASLNNFCKVAPDAWQLWGSILAALPHSRLLIHAAPGAHRERFCRQIAAQGVAPERVEFFDRLTLAQYLRLHHAIDLALDSFPYAGGTTTCDALWMGVPTVSLVGEAAFMRGGLSIFSNLGLPEFAVFNRHDYFQRSVAWAMDLDRLATLRASMRQRMLSSALMNGKGFAGELEGVLERLG